MTAHAHPSLEGRVSELEARILALETPEAPEVPTPPPAAPEVRTVYPGQSEHTPRPWGAWSRLEVEPGTVIAGGEVYRDNSVPRTMYHAIRQDSIASRYAADHGDAADAAGRVAMWLGCDYRTSVRTSVGKAYSSHLAGLFMGAAEMGVTLEPNYTTRWKNTIIEGVGDGTFAPDHNFTAGALLLFGGLEALTPSDLDKGWLRQAIHDHLNATFGDFRPHAARHPSRRYGNYICLHLNAACQLATLAEARLDGPLGQRATEACTRWASKMLPQLLRWADTHPSKPITLILPDGTPMVDDTGHPRSSALVDNTIGWAHYLGWTTLIPNGDDPSPYWSMGTAPRRAV